MDEFAKEEFTLRGIIIVTINDYPALFSLSGQIKGKTGCLVCLDDTSFLFLEGSRKIVYVRYRRWLVEGHRYRRKKFYRCFDCNAELRSAPIRRKDSKHIFDMAKALKGVRYGKKVKKSKTSDGSGPPFKKLSIFFRYLPYWKDLQVGHAIGCMHLKKNVFDSTIGLLMDIPRKTKDGLKSRRDLVALGIREELHPIENGNGKFTLPAASYNLTQEEKREIRQCIRGLKVPTGFSSKSKDSCIGSLLLT